MKDLRVNIVLFSFFCLFFFFRSVTVAGQDLYYTNHLFFTELSMNKGLPRNAIFSLIQDENGFIWLGAEGSITRYDGVDLKIYRPPEEDPSLDPIKKNTLTAICEDNYGNFWLGTSGISSGLNRLDPSTGQFFHYPYAEGSPGSITDSSVTSIVMDDNAKLWVGTVAGLNMVTFDPNNPDSLISVLKFTSEKKSGGQEYSGQLMSNAVLDLLIDREDNLWIATAKGLNVLPLKRLSNSDNEGFRFLDFNNTEGADQLLFGHAITSLSKGPDGKIFIAGIQAAGVQERAFLQLYDPLENKSYPIPFLQDIGKEISDVLYTRNGELWLATYGEGLKKVVLPGNGGDWQKGLAEPLEFKTFDFGMNYGAVDRRNWIMNLMEDHSGTIWVGTFYYGAYKLPSFARYIKYYAPLDDHEKEITIVRVVEDTLENYWVVTTDHGLYKWNRVTGEIRQYRHDPEDPSSIPSDFVGHLYKNQQGEVYVSTAEGLSIFEEDEGHFHPLNNLPNAPQKFAWQAFEYEDGILWWAGYMEALFLYDPRGRKFWKYWFDPEIYDTNGKNSIWQIYRDREGTYWVATGGGLMRVTKGKDGELDYGNLSFEEVDFPFKRRLIAWVTEDSEGRFWVSSFSGLMLYDRLTKETLKTYKSGVDYPLNLANMMYAKEDGTLWLSGDKAIVRFDPEKENFQVFDGSTGISYCPFGRFFTPNSKGELIASSGKNGFYFVTADSLKPNPTPPIILLDEFFLFNERVVPGEGGPLDSAITNTKYLTLQHNQNNLAFGYIGLHYDRTDKIQYAYKMQGIDKDWVYVDGERTARYPKLAPGEYTFQVKAANADGVWNKEGASVEILILKPWWNTLLAWAIYILIFGGTIIFIYQRELKNRLQQQEALRLAELDAVKTRLYTNITHEFRTPLTIIQGMADQVIQDPEKWVPEGLEMIKRNGKSLLHLVNQMLDLSKIESGSLPLHLVHGDVMVYLKYLFESFYSIADNKDITLDFVSETENIPMDYDPDKLLNIVYNLMSNALRYTPVGGRVTMKAGLSGGPAPQLNITIADTGIGIAKDQLPYIFDRFYQAEEGNTGGTGVGLAMVKELVNLLKGKVDVESETGKGTTFFIWLPVTHDAPEVDSPVSTEVDQILPYVFHKESMELDFLLAEEDEKPVLLIVEDNMDVVIYLSSFLGKHYQLLKAADGEEGIRLALEKVPDIILSDVMMPVKDGYQLCQTIKSDERTSHVPILLLTAKADAASQMEGLELGADVYLTKPIVREELELRLRNLLNNRKRLQEYFSQKKYAAGGVEQYPKENTFLQKINSILDANLDDENFGIEELCKALFISRMQLHRKLKALTGKTTSHYLRNYRLEKAREMLLHTDKTVTEIAFEVGFKSPGYFSSSFAEEFGKPPQEFRK